MQTSNASQNFCSDDPIWILLAELSFLEFVSDQDQRGGLVARSMFQTLQELGISPEEIENIARTVAGFAKESSVHTKQGKLEFPGLIRILCQKKMIDDVGSAKTSQPYRIEQVKKQKQIFSGIGTIRTGGWGYFIIERGEDLRSDSPAISKSYIDLYLYQEGD